jgi:DNA-binding NarL/FixJ family response regulator
MSLASGSVFGLVRVVAAPIATLSLARERLDRVIAMLVRMTKPASAVGHRIAVTTTAGLGLGLGLGLASLAGAGQDAANRLRRSQHAAGRIAVDLCALCGVFAASPSRALPLCSPAVTLTVDVWDPSTEGRWIVERLRQEGLDVASIELADVVLTRASLVVMAGDAHGALGALKLLRDDGVCGDVPVVLLGVPDGIEHAGDGPAFGADAIVMRPVAFDALLRCVRRLLDGRESELSHVGPQSRAPARSEQSDEDDSQVFAVRPDANPFAPREPTLQLKGALEPIEEDTPPRIKSSITSARDRRTPSGTSSGSRAHIEHTPEPILAPDQRAELSPWLEELLSVADRRVFPDLPPLSLHFPAADEAPEVLVPPELLEAPALRIDEPVHEDPIDAFTYVGGPAVPRQIRDSTPSPPDVPSPREQRAEPPPLRDLPIDREQETALADVAPEPQRPPERRVDPSHGVLERGGLARLLAQTALAGSDALIEVHGTIEARLGFSAGVLVELEGDVARGALGALRRRGRATEAPADEAGALEALSRRVERGELSRFERDRLLREAREDLLVRLLAAERTSYSVRALERRAQIPGAARFFPLLVEASRRAFRDADVRALLGNRGLALGRDRAAALAAAGLRSELVELFLAMEGRTLVEILAAAPTEPGLAGVVYALVVGEALVLGDPAAAEASSPEAGRSARALLEAASALAEDGDYFAILGLAHGAGDADVARAREARRDELEAIPLGLLGLSSLADAREDAIEAIDEAARVLMDGRLREAYAASLAR